MEIITLNNEVTREAPSSAALETSLTLPNNINTIQHETTPSMFGNKTKGSFKPNTTPKSPMRIFRSKLRRIKGFVVFALFASIAMTIGVLTVYFVSKDKTRYHSKPTSVAIADFNNDQRLDIVVANTDSDNLGLFFGHGDGTFTNQITLSTDLSSQPQSVAVGDFNNDNRSDIAVASYNAHNVGIFLGYGDGTFSHQMTTSTDSSRPQSIAVGDFNNDNRLDVTIANPDTQSVGVFLGCGDGTFSRQTMYFTGYDSNPFAVAVGDVNNDHQLDIAVCNKNTRKLGVFLGYGNGSFARQTIYSTDLHSSPISVAIGDFNDDSDLDIAVANSDGHNVGIFLGYGNGRFVAQTTYSDDSSSQPYSVPIGDFNNDTKLDIAVVDNNADGVKIFLGDGDGSFTFLALYYTSPFSLPTAGAVGDFNNDTQLDIAVAVYTDGNVQALLGYGNGSLKTSMILPTGSGAQPKSVAVGDFNNDTRLDIVVANWRTNCVGVFLGYGDGSFSKQTTYSTGDNSRPQSVAFGDFNNDNKLDIIVANTIADNVGVFLGYGNGSFAPQIKTTSTIPGSYSVAVADFSNDSQLDAVVPNYDDNYVTVLLGYGNGSLTLFNTYFTGTDSRPNSASVGDFNNDNRLDIVVANYYSNNVGVFLGYGNGSFASQITSYVGDDLSQQFVGIADFNNDSRLDIIVTIFDRGGVCVLFGCGNGSFTNSTFYSMGVDSGPRAVVIGHFNNDTRLDIAVANDITPNLGILFGDEHGNFTNLMTYPAGYGASSTSLAIGDFNNDTLLDIVMSNDGTHTIGIFLRLC